MVIQLKVFLTLGSRRPSDFIFSFVISKHKTVASTVDRIKRVSSPAGFVLPDGESQDLQTSRLAESFVFVCLWKIDVSNSALPLKTLPPKMWTHFEQRCCVPIVPHNSLCLSAQLSAWKGLSRQITSAFQYARQRNGTKKESLADRKIRGRAAEGLWAYPKIPFGK